MENKTHTCTRHNHANQLTLFLAGINLNQCKHKDSTHTHKTHTQITENYDIVLGLYYINAYIKTHKHMTRTNADIVLCLHCINANTKTKNANTKQNSNIESAFTKNYERKKQLRQLKKTKSARALNQKQHHRGTQNIQKPLAKPKTSKLNHDQNCRGCCAMCTL